MKVPIKKYINNAFIYLSGKVLPKEFYIVKSGKVKIIRTNPILGESEDIRGAGYIFGIIQCLTGIPEEESVKAITDCEIFIITKERIEELFINKKQVILKILSEYSEILRKLDADLINYNSFSASINRKEKIFDVVKKYIHVNQQKKAAHLLNSIINEFPDDPDIQKKAESILPKLERAQVLYKKEIIYEQKIPSDTVIFTEFELANYFYIIKKGKIKITKLRHDKEILLAILGDGDIFGEMAVLNDKHRNAAACSVEDTELMVIDKKGIDKLPPPLFKKLLEFLSKRIWLVQQQLICCKLPSVTAKIYYLLTSKVKQVTHDPEEECSNSFIFHCMFNFHPKWIHPFSPSK